MTELAVIGGGPAGYKAAAGAARAGAQVTLIEEDRPGGTCLNEGCIPSHSMLHAAVLIEDVAALRGHGLAGDISGDFAGAARHRDAVVASMREGVGATLRRLGVKLVPGRARFETRGRLRIRGESGESVLEAEQIVIASGARTRELEACPLDGRVVVGSREFFTSVTQLPERVLCIGGGAIGVEAAWIARQFGAQVTLVERAPQLLAAARLPELAAELLERKLARLGVIVKTGVVPLSCTVREHRARVALSDGSDEEFGLVLVAVGRVPNVADLGLEQAGVDFDLADGVHTNEFLETSAPGVFAIGDARGGLMTANAALYDAKLVVGNAVTGERQRANYFKVPFVVRSALEIATVGLTEAQAETAGFSARVARAALGATGKARARAERDGFVEIVHDAETGQLLGGCIVGHEAGEQIQLFGAACQSPRGLWLFRDLSYSHPSWCEEVETALDANPALFVRAAAQLFRPGILAGE